MYQLSYFTEENQERVLDFMKENPFAIVTGIGDEYPVASHLPLWIEKSQDGKLFFYGHLMKKTDHHLAFEKNERVLVVFNGPHTYVSASWYSNPQSASTWNYMAVHAKGKIRFTDEEGTLHAIRSITNQYEGTDSPASFDQLPKTYVDKLLNAIVGFCIEVTSIGNAFKLSQNHTATTRESIADHLEARGDAHSTAIAREMKRQGKA